MRKIASRSFVRFVGLNSSRVVGSLSYSPFFQDFQPRSSNPVIWTHTYIYIERWRGPFLENWKWQRGKRSRRTARELSWNFLFRHSVSPGIPASDDEDIKRKSHRKCEHLPLSLRLLIEKSSRNDFRAIARRYHRRSMKSLKLSRVQVASEIKRVNRRDTRTNIYRERLDWRWNMVTDRRCWSISDLNEQHDSNHFYKSQIIVELHLHIETTFSECYEMCMVASSH